MGNEKQYQFTSGLNKMAKQDVNDGVIQLNEFKFDVGQDLNVLYIISEDIKLSSARRSSRVKLLDKTERQIKYSKESWNYYEIDLQGLNAQQRIDLYKEIKMTYSVDTSLIINIVALPRKINDFHMFFTWTDRILEQNGFTALYMNETKGDLEKLDQKVKKNPKFSNDLEHIINRYNKSNDMMDIVNVDCNYWMSKAPSFKRPDSMGFVTEDGLIMQQSVYTGSSNTSGWKTNRAKFEDLILPNIKKEK